MTRDKMNSEKNIKVVLNALDPVERVKLIRALMLVQEATADLTDDEKNIVCEMWMQRTLDYNRMSALIGK